MKKLMAFIAVLSFVACANKKDNKENPASENDSQSPVSAYKVISKADLTEAQISEIKEIAKKAEILPAENLFLATDEESETEKEKRLKKIGVLPEKSQQAVNSIIKKCKVEKVNSVQNGSLKEVGSKEMTYDQLRLFGGSSCPVEAVKKMEKEKVFLESNREDLKKEFQETKDESVFEKGLYKYGSKQIFTEVLTVTDSDLQDQSAVKERETVSNYSGEDLYSPLGYKVEYKGTILIKTTMTNGKTIVSKIYVHEVEAMIEKKVSSGQYVEIEVEFPSLTASIQVFKEISEEKKYFLNGKDVSREKIKEIFGEGLFFLP
ncbi:MAG: hypothetical protein ACAH59_03065 [Pseudobdellovibrionaceae bacterium]